ncbi:hypothetical protein [Candidatus Thiodictyon syntrophicum]|uniref:hypothetical protein n=1 Tax=Candidatus Thiodictyon syntrophicum TaxID=1166950 RepID=UPI0012FD4006|nr:hypothetical protein [Candidatus Thiodictyon syntrophicum]
MYDRNDSAQTIEPKVLYLGTDPKLPKRLAALLAEQGIDLRTADDHDAAARPATGPKYLALILETALLAPGPRRPRPDRPGLGQRRALCPGHPHPAPAGPADLRLG